MVRECHESIYLEEISKKVTGHNDSSFSPYRPAMRLLLVSCKKEIECPEKGQRPFSTIISLTNL